MKLGRLGKLGTALSLALACGGRPEAVAPPAALPTPVGRTPAPAEAEPTAQAPATSTQTSSMPLRLAKTGHLLVPVAFGEQRYDFILDTGASVTVITPQTRAEIGLAADAGSAVKAAGANGQISDVRVVQLPPMQVGGRDYKATQAAVMPLAHLEAPLGEQLPGILGQNFLSEHHLDLDFARERVTLHSTAQAAPHVPQGQQIDYTYFEIAQLIRLEVSINGSKPFPAVLDLGAGRSILNWRAAKLLGLGPQHPQLHDAEEPMLGADNQPLELKRKSFAELDVGSLRIRDAELHIGDIGVFETLGMSDGPAMVFGVDMLAGRRVVIDYGAKRLQVGPEFGAAQALPAATVQ